MSLDIGTWEEKIRTIQRLAVMVERTGLEVKRRKILNNAPTETEPAISPSEFFCGLGRVFLEDLEAAAVSEQGFAGAGLVQ